VAKITGTCEQQWQQDDGNRDHAVPILDDLDNIITQGCNLAKLENTTVAQRQNLTRIQKEMNKLRSKLKVMVECCPNEISSEWEIIFLRQALSQQDKYCLLIIPPRQPLLMSHKGPPK
jgi:hypothetical protein